MATPLDVATWMTVEFQSRGRLGQAHAAREIERQFGPTFVYRDKNNNQPIVAEVLTEFQRLTTDAVWVRGGFYWRKRKPGE